MYVFISAGLVSFSVFAALRFHSLGSHNIDSEAELQANDNNRTESLLLLLSVFAVSKSISFDEMTA